MDKIIIPLLLLLIIIVWFSIDVIDSLNAKRYCESIGGEISIEQFIGRFCYFSTTGENVFLENKNGKWEKSHALSCGIMHGHDSFIKGKGC